MGIDIGSYLIYGIQTEYREFVPYDECNENDENIISKEDIEQYNITFKNDSYTDSVS